MLNLLFIVYVCYFLYSYLHVIYVVVTKSAVFDAGILFHLCTGICCEDGAAFQMSDYSYLCKSFVCRLFLLIK